MRNRAQSEVVGFVVVFAVIVLAVAIVSATGFSTLRGVHDHERTVTAERGMVVLADNVDHLVANEAPSRATEIKVAGGTLSVGEPVTVNVTGERVGDPTETFTVERSVRPIVYESGDGTSITYENGAVIREDGSGSVLIREPRLVIDEAQTVIPVIAVRSTPDRSVGGSKTVLVRTELNGTEVLRQTTAPYRVTLTLTTPRATSWERALDAHREMDCSRAGDTVTCEFTTRQIAVTGYEVEMGLF